MNADNDSAFRRLIILGSTGSIGTNALAVVDHLHRRRLRRFEVVGLAAGSNAQLISEQARRFGVQQIAVADAAVAAEAGLNGFERIHAGPDSALRLVEAVARPGDLVIGAMVGSAGLPATLAAIERGCDIALANKETLVAAGELVVNLARARNVHLLPVDSEHSAIFQCLQAGRSADEVARLVLTASGGPFRTWPIERMHHATVEQTLAHPTWAMGPKVTVDSASLMNKALEVIEARWLFGMRADQITVVVHPQSIVHSFVEFVDGSVVAQLSPPDMKAPIQYALTWPDRLHGCAPRMDWTSAGHLDFEPVDPLRYPALGMAFRVIAAGGTAGAIFNGANEAAVAAFMNHRIAFGEIARLVGETIESLEPGPLRSLDDVYRADEAARAHVARVLERRKGAGHDYSPGSTMPIRTGHTVEKPGPAPS